MVFLPSHGLLMVAKQIRGSLLDVLVGPEIGGQVRGH